MKRRALSCYAFWTAKDKRWLRGGEDEGVRTDVSALFEDPVDRVDETHLVVLEAQTCDFRAHTLPLKF